MLLKIIYSDSSSITVRLFEKPAVRKWFNFFKVKSMQPNFYSFSTIGIRQSIYFLHSQYFLKRSPKWKMIESSFQQLRGMGYNVPKELIVTHNTYVDQQFFNQLHRFFTYNMIWYDEQHVPNPYDPSFKLPPSISIWEWHKIIDPINLAVHDLETKVNATDNKKYSINHYPNEVFSFRNTTINQDNWLAFDSSDELENFTFFDTPNKPIVFLDDSILGKSVIQSFLDNDDPSCRDCTGRKGSFGSFWIDFNNNRKELYKSKQFLNWLEQHKLNPETMPYEFSIGYVEEITHSPKRFKFFKKRFKEVIFIDD